MRPLTFTRTTLTRKHDLFYFVVEQNQRYFFIILFNCFLSEMTMIVLIQLFN